MAKQGAGNPYTASKKYAGWSVKHLTPRPPDLAYQPLNQRIPSRKFHPLPQLVLSQAGNANR
jgi:hypothetical protein